MYGTSIEENYYCFSSPVNCSPNKFELKFKISKYLSIAHGIWNIIRRLEATFRRRIRSARWEDTTLGFIHQMIEIVFHYNQRTSSFGTIPSTMAYNMACCAPGAGAPTTYTFDDVTHQEAAGSSISLEGLSKDSTIETDYQNITPLFRNIEREDWKAILLFLSTGRWSIGLLASNDHLGNPPPAAQVKTWVTKYSNDGSIEWSQLPIHAAVSAGAPCAIIQKLSEMYPKGLHASDNEGMLPIHLAFEFNVPDSVITFLLAAAPETIHIKGPGDRYPYECCELGPNKSRGKLFKLIIDQITLQTREEVEKERLSFPVQEIVTSGVDADAILQELATESDTSSEESEKKSDGNGKNSSKKASLVKSSGSGQDSQDKSVADILKDLQHSSTSISFDDSRSDAEFSEEEERSTEIFSLNNSTIDTRSLVNHPFAKIMTPRGGQGATLKQITEEGNSKDRDSFVKNADDDGNEKDQILGGTSTTKDHISILEIATDSTSELHTTQSQPEEQNLESAKDEKENSDKHQSTRFGRLLQCITTPKSIKKTDSISGISFHASLQGKKKMPSKQPRLPPGITVLSPRMSSTGLLNQSSTPYVSTYSKGWASESIFQTLSKSKADCPSSVKNSVARSSSAVSIVNAYSGSISTKGAQNTRKESVKTPSKSTHEKEMTPKFGHNVLINEGEEYEAVFNPHVPVTPAPEHGDKAQQPVSLKRDPDGKHADKGRHHSHVGSIIPPANMNDEMSTLDILAQFAVMEEEDGIEAVHCK